MDITALYHSKLTTPQHAVAAIRSGSKLSMGMATTEAPALLGALADRAVAGLVGDLKLYYYEATSIAGNSVLRYELVDRIRPYSCSRTQMSGHQTVGTKSQRGSESLFAAEADSSSTSTIRLTSEFRLKKGMFCRP